MVRVPESMLDFYFHVANISMGGLALVTASTEGFPIKVDSVLDIEVFSSAGSVRCRGVVARCIEKESDGPRGFGVKLYGFCGNDDEAWKRLLNDQSQFGLY
jgi:hypothetical protein